MGNHSVLGVPMLKGPEGGELYNRIPQLSGFLSGLMGTAPDELPGSVLDPLREKAQAGAKWGFGLGTALNVVPVLAPGLAMLKGSASVPKLAASQAGAIRIGGNPDNYLSHVFALNKAKAIADSEKLISPSLGISNARPNDYGAGFDPSFVFKAGTADPADTLGTLINRDGYFANPNGLHGGDSTYSPERHVQEILDTDKRMTQDYGAKDWRLLQSAPGTGHTMSIAASPAFKSFADFEASPLGQGRLDEFNKLGKYGSRDAWSQMDENIRRAGLDKHDVLDMYRADNIGQPPSQWPQKMGKLWTEAQNAPSAMAEFKMRENLPISPENAFVHLPENFDPSPANLQALAPLRDKGFNFVPYLDTMYASHPDGSQAASMRELARIAAPDGTFKFPPRAPIHPPLLQDFLDGGNAFQPRTTTSPFQADPLTTKAPKFKDVEEASNWLMDNGDEVHAMLDDAKDMDPHIAATLTDSQDLHLHQVAADLAHTPGFMSQHNWHEILMNHLNNKMHKITKGNPPADMLEAPPGLVDLSNLFGEF